MKGCTFENEPGQAWPLFDGIIGDRSHVLNSVAMREQSLILPSIPSTVAVLAGGHRLGSLITTRRKVSKRVPPHTFSSLAAV